MPARPSDKELSPYLKDNTTLRQYKDHLVSGV
jgi:hypothetical protein